MKVKRLYNTGEALRSYEYEILEKEKLGRFGATEYSIFGGIEIGREYLVMGIIIFQDYQGYLIDDNGFISVYPSQLFEVIDDRIDYPNWHFRLIEKRGKYLSLYTSYFWLLRIMF